mgnify:CR=1 FL=1
MHVCTQKRKRNQGAIQYKREESQTKGTNSKEKLKVQRCWHTDQVPRRWPKPKFDGVRYSENNWLQMEQNHLSWLQGVSKALPKRLHTVCGESRSEGARAI